MSIASEITRLSSAKAALKDAIVAKGVEVADSLKLDGYAEKVAAIPTGGAFEPPEGWPDSETDRNSYLWVKVEEDGLYGLSVALGLRTTMDNTNIGNSFIVDYGDETTPVRCIARTNAQNMPIHIYAKAGLYRIKITPETQGNRFRFGNSYENVLSGGIASSPVAYNAASNMLIAAYIGDGWDPTNTTSGYIGEFNGCSKIVAIKCYKDCLAYSNITIPLVIQQCFDLKEIQFPKMSFELSSNFFYQAHSLRTVNLDDINISEIPSGAFSGLGELRNITIPDGVVAIRANAFYGSGIGNIVIPSSVRTIENSAFSNISSLKEIEFEDVGDTDGVSNLIFDGTYILRYNGFLERIIMRCIVPPILTSAQSIFISAYNKFGINTKIYIPYGTMSAYLSAPNWAQFSSRFIEMNEDGSIPE